MPLTKFTPEELTQLKTEFKELPTVEEKFRFWNDRLNHRYMWIGVNVPTSEVNDFLILPKTAEEREELNLHLLDEIETFYLISPKSPLIYYESLKKGFNDRLEGAVNPMPILKEALKRVEKEVENMVFKQPAQNSMSNDIFYKKELSDSWHRSYELKYLRGIDLNYGVVIPSMASIIGAHNGYAVACYRLYVERKIEEVEDKQKKRYQDETPLKRQLLIMEYTGMLDKLYQLPIQHKDRNKLLSVLLNMSEQSIKQELTNLPKRSHVYKIRTEENYSFLLDLFTEVGLTEQAKEVKNEKDKLKQERK